MSRQLLSRILHAPQRINAVVAFKQRDLHRTVPLACAESKANTKHPTFDEGVLEYLVCPLSKARLRYDETSQELICDEVGVAYSIVNGIPNLLPQEARKLHSDPSPESKET